MKEEVAAETEPILNEKQVQVKKERKLSAKRTVGERPWTINQRGSPTRTKGGKKRKD